MHLTEWLLVWKGELVSQIQISPDFVAFTFIPMLSGKHESISSSVYGLNIRDWLFSICIPISFKGGLFCTSKPQRR